MAGARGCTGVFSNFLQIPAHSCAQPLKLPHTRGAPLTTLNPHRCRSRRPLSSADEYATTAVSLPSRSSASSVFFLCHAAGGVGQLRVTKSFHTSGPFSSHGVAAPSSSFSGLFVSTRRRMATLQSGAPVSLAPAAPSSAEQEMPTALEASAATTAESPAVIHQVITSEQRLLARMNALKTHLLAANWQDYLSFVLNSAFWEAEMRLLEVEARPFKHSSSRVKGQLRDLRRLFDLMAQASDVRDHINQILELGSRATGLAGTGLNASDKVENFEDHVQAAVAEYDRLLKEYPEYCSLVDDCLGSGLAMMRQKQRFTFSALHRFFY